MRKALPYVIFTAIGCAIVFFKLKGCNDKPGPDHTQDKVFVDSVVEKAKKDSVEAKVVVSHLTDSLAIMRRENDSLISQQQKSKELVNKAGKQILGLSSRIDSLKKNNDIAGQLAGCDSLRAMYDDAASVVGSYEYMTDSLIGRLKLERHLADSVKNYLWNMFSQANNQVFALGLKYDQLHVDYAKINKKPSRLSFGPSIGVYVTKEGLRPGIGMSFTYDLKKR